MEIIKPILKDILKFLAKQIIMMMIRVVEMMKEGTTPMERQVIHNLLILLLIKLPK
jgi:hypothetical protein